jgi:hypothetical protein
MRFKVTVRVRAKVWVRVTSTLNQKFGHEAAPAKKRKVDGKKGRWIKKTEGGWKKSG